MSKNYFLVFFILLLAIIPINLRLLSHPAIEFDEGVYLTSFILFQKGFQFYSQIFFSQPPGFIALTLPFFQIFGYTLEAGRFAVFFWSLVGICGILWVAYELRIIRAGFLAIAILYALPLYFTETLTFHADYLALVFTILPIASILRFKNTRNNFFLYLTGVFLAISILTKLNVIPFFLVGWVLMKNRFYLSKRNTIFSLLIFLATILVFILPFDIKQMFNQAILFRIHAADYFQNQNKFFEYMNNDRMLFLLLLATLVFVFIAKSHLKKFGVLLIWFLITLIILFFYRPLMPHHMLFLTVPLALVFSSLIAESLSLYTTKKALNHLIFTALFLSITLFGLTAFRIPQKITSLSQDKIIEYINKNTKQSDLLVTDDAILYAKSKRLVPPELVDLSQVRLDSGYLAPQEFERLISIYKPKLIIPSNNRLIKLPQLKEILMRHNYLPLTSPKLPIFISTF